MLNDFQGDDFYLTAAVDHQFHDAWQLSWLSDSFNHTHRMTVVLGQAAEALDHSQNPNELRFWIEINGINNLIFD
jgi:hypothetical protein